MFHLGAPRDLTLTLTLTRRTGWRVYAASRRRPAYPGAPPGVLPPISARDATSSHKARSALGVVDAMERAGEAEGSGDAGEAPWEAPSDEFWEEAEETGPSLEFLIAATRQPRSRMVDGAFV